MELPSYNKGIPIAQRAISTKYYGKDYSPQTCQIEIMLSTAADPESQQGNTTPPIDLNKKIGNNGGFFDVTRVGAGFLEGVTNYDFNVNTWTLTAELPTQTGDMAPLTSINLNYFLTVIDDQPVWTGLSPNIRDTCEGFTLTVDRKAHTAIYGGHVLGPSGQWNYRYIDLQLYVGYNSKGFYKKENQEDKGLLDYEQVTAGNEFRLSETGYTICVDELKGTPRTIQTIEFDLSRIIANSQGNLVIFELDEMVEPISSDESFALNYPGLYWYEVVKYGAQGKWDQAKFYYAKGQYTAAVWAGAAIGELLMPESRVGRIIGTIVGTIVGIGVENAIGFSIKSGQVRAALDPWKFKDIVKEAVKNVLNNETAAAFTARSVKEAKLLWENSAIARSLTEKTKKVLEDGFETGIGEASAGPVSMETEDLLNDLIFPIIDAVLDALAELHGEGGFMIITDPEEPAITN